MAKGQATNLKDLSEAIKSMPQYKELLPLPTNSFPCPRTQGTLLHSIPDTRLTYIHTHTHTHTQELLSKYSMHIDLTKRCMARYEVSSVKRDLISVKRDLISVKRDLISVKRDLISVKRDLTKTCMARYEVSIVSKET